MKKWDLVKALADKTGVSQKDVNAVIDSLSETIVTECRDNGDSINIPNLGIFKQKVNAPRKGRNPITGEPLEIKESRTIALRPSAALKLVIEPKKAPAKKAKK